MPNWLKNILKWEPGVSLAQWAYDRIANNLQTFVTVFAAGGGMTYLGSITAWVAAWGPFGIGAAGLVSAMLTWVCLAIIASFRAKARLSEAHRAAIEKWKDRVDDVNPLLPEFHTKRLRLSDLASPINRAIESKRFIDCELLGPANLILSDVEFDGVLFEGCDAVAVKHMTPIHNAIHLQSIKMIGGKIWNCTLLIPLKEVSKFTAMPVTFVSLTELPQIDNRG